MFGDSIAWWAYHHFGPPAGSPGSFRFVSFCQRGARLQDIKVATERAWRTWGPPATAIIHVGTNELCRRGCRELRDAFDDLWMFIRCLPGNTTFLYSDMVPRPQGGGPDDWRPDDVRIVDRRRRDTNRFVRRLSARQGGGFIKHPDIALDEPHLFRGDGLHLSVEGCRLFMRDIVSVIVALEGQ